MVVRLRQNYVVIVALRVICDQDNTCKPTAYSHICYSSYASSLASLLILAFSETCLTLGTTLGRHVARLCAVTLLIERLRVVTARTTSRHHSKLIL